MIDEIQKLLDEYAVWLRHKTTLREVNQEWLEITSPYLDRHNDYIQNLFKAAKRRLPAHGRQPHHSGLATVRLCVRKL